MTCLASIHICRVRATRLNADGTVASGPNNAYVSDKPIQLGITPVITAGTERELVGGCDCLTAAYKGYDKLRRFDFELDLGNLEPALIEMLVGASAILGGSGGADVIGNWFSENAFDCSTPPPNIALEAWTDGWEEDHQHPTFPYIHFIWPSTFWQIGPFTLQNDFLQPRLNGFSRGNTAWGTGPYGDLPEAVGALGGFFETAHVPPTASCGFSTASSS